MKKVLSIFVAMLLVMAVVVPTIASCPRGSGDEKGVREAVDVLAGAVKELQGAEKSRVPSMALENEGVKKLQKQLQNEGYTQKDLKAYNNVPVKTKDGSIVEIQVVVINYESSDSSKKDTGIIYAYNPETGSSIVTRGIGWACIYCACGLLYCSSSDTFFEFLGCLLSPCNGVIEQCSCCCCEQTGNPKCCDICSGDFTETYHQGIVVDNLNDFIGSQSAILFETYQGHRS